MLLEQNNNKLKLLMELGRETDVVISFLSLLPPLWVFLTSGHFDLWSPFDSSVKLQQGRWQLFSSLI